MIFVQEILDGIDNLKNLCIDSETEVCPELCPNDKCAIQILYNKLMKHGHWVFDDPLKGDFMCDNCLERNIVCTKYCPNCGARMDKEE